MLEHERPVFLVQVLIEADTRCCSCQYAFECGLAHQPADPAADRRR